MSEEITFNNCEECEDLKELTKFFKSLTNEKLEELRKSKQDVIDNIDIHCDCNIDNLDLLIEMITHEFKVRKLKKLIKFAKREFSELKVWDGGRKELKLEKLKILMRKLISQDSVKFTNLDQIELEQIEKEIEPDEAKREIKLDEAEREAEREAAEREATKREAKREAFAARVKKNHDASKAREARKIQDVLEARRLRILCEEHKACELEKCKLIEELELNNSLSNVILADAATTHV